MCGLISPHDTGTQLENVVLRTVELRSKSVDLQKYYVSGQIQLNLPRSNRPIGDNYFSFYPGERALSFIEGKAQVRLATSYSKKIIINKAKYQIDFTSISTACNIFENESILHLSLNLHADNLLDSTLCLLPRDVRI